MNMTEKVLSELGNPRIRHSRWSQRVTADRREHVVYNSSFSGATTQRLELLWLLGKAGSSDLIPLPIESWSWEILDLRSEEPGPEALEVDMQVLRPMPDSKTELRQKVSRTSNYFRRKASAVLADAYALELLADLYEAGVMDKPDLDLCERCDALAKLAAANLCELGENIVYITPAGRQFIDRIQDA